jgi:arylsulfatase A-like enzyme
VLLYMVALYLALLLPPQLTAGIAKTPPNFLFVMSDDVGWGDHSYNCDNSSCPVAPPDGDVGAAAAGKCPSCAFCCAPTPHLDEMAGGPNTLLFHRAYAGSACCSPTRAAVLTGRAPQRSCIDSALGAGQTPAWAKPAKKQLPWGQFTLSAAAKAAGMDTFFMGKWHLGDFWDFDPEDSQPPGMPGFSHPGVFGFDTWYATKASAASSTLNCNCYANATNCAAGGGLLGPSKLLCTNYWTNTDPTASVYATNVSNHTGKEMGDDNEYIVDHFEAWLREHDRGARRPWLGVLWLHTVHVPHPAMPRWFNSVPYPAKNGDYQGTIAQMDSQIGRLRLLLKELGIANNTAVFYTSDNGPHAQSIDTGVSVGGFLPNGDYFNGLRQCKGSIFDGGVRVPGMLEWPAMIHHHRETWLPMTVFDYLPTVLDVLGLERPARCGVRCVLFGGRCD